MPNRSGGSYEQPALGASHATTSVISTASPAVERTVSVGLGDDEARRAPSREARLGTAHVASPPADASASPGSGSTPPLRRGGKKGPHRPLGSAGANTRPHPRAHRSP